MPSCRVVILAAGTSTRLQTGSRQGPKQLAQVLDRSLAARSLACFIAAGHSDFAVVLGSEAELVRSHYSAVAEELGVAIDFVVAHDYALGNGASALAARPFARTRPVLLTMSDHLFGNGLIETLVAAQLGPSDVGLAVDLNIDDVFDLDDLTKVEVADGQIVAIGKRLPSWNAGDTGLFHASEELFRGLDKARAEGLHSLSDGVRQCIAGRGVRAVGITGCRWVDVDTPEALAEAERLVQLGELR